MDGVGLYSFCNCNYERNNTLQKKSFDKMKSKEERNAYDSLVAFVNRHGISPKEEERLRGIIKKIGTYNAKQEAIAFINWTLQSECEYSCTDEDQWTHQDILENGIVQNITTEQLYNLYLESKKQKYESDRNRKANN